MIDPPNFVPSEADWRSLKRKERFELGQAALMECFRGTAGLRAYMHLKEKFDQPAFIAQQTKDGTLGMDPYFAAYREGQRNAFEYIESVIKYESFRVSDLPE